MALPILLPIAKAGVQLGLVYIAGQVQRDWSKRPKAEQLYPREFDRPASPLGQAIPIVFGTRWIKDAAILWWGDVSATEWGGGIVYNVGVHFGIAHAPVDAILEIKAGEVTIWDTEVDSNSILDIEAWDAFGGYEGEGGIEGRVDIIMGADDEIENAYLATGGDITGLDRPLNGAFADYPRLPPFRGVLQAVLNFVMISFNTPQFRPWSFLVRRQDSEAVGDDMNPAEILKVLLTNEDYGLNLPEADLDDASFAAAATALEEEGLGLSFIWDTTSPVQDVIMEVLRHIMAALYTDFETGKLVLTLIRQDYTVEELLTVDETIIEEVSAFEQPSLGELKNTVIVHFRNRDNDTQTITLHNQGLIAQQAGQVIPQEISYEMATEESVAQQLAARDLYNLSMPLRSITFTGHRSLAGLRLADPFVLSFDRYDLDEVVFRVAWIDYGTLTDGTITVQAVEDMVGLADSLYAAPASNWETPINEPTASANRQTHEAPYYSLYLTYGAYAGTWNLLQTNLGSDGGYALLLARRPTLDSAQYRLYSQGPDDADYVSRVNSVWIPTGTLTEDLDKEVQTTTVVAGLSTGDYAQFAALDIQFCLIEHPTGGRPELCEILSYTAATGSFTLRRGVLDTVPQEHLTDARVWFPDAQTSLGVGWDGEIYNDAEEVSFKALTITSLGTLAIADAPSDSITLAGRFFRPYPPGNFLLNTERWPDFITGDLVVAWTHRNRLTQITGYTAQDATGIDTEADVTYTLRIYDENDALAKEETGLTGVEYSDYTVADEITDLGIGRPNESLRVVLLAVRDALDSWHSQEHTIDECRGYGMFYGAYYGE